MPHVGETEHSSSKAFRIDIATIDCAAEPFNQRDSARQGSAQMSPLEEGGEERRARDERRGRDKNLARSDSLVTIFRRWVVAEAVLADGSIASASKPRRSGRDIRAFGHKQARTAIDA